MERRCLQRTLWWRLTVGFVFAAVMLSGSSAVAGDAQRLSYEIGVDGMACPFCAYGIEKKLKALDGTGAIEIHIKEGTIDLTAEEGSSVTPDQIEQAVEDAGFETRSLHLSGRATVEKRDDSVVAIFDDEFRLPIETANPETGKQTVSGEVVQKRGDWKIVVSSEKER